MSFRSLLPHLVQPFRPRQAERPLEPIFLDPKDVLEIMALVEHKSLHRSGIVERHIASDPCEGLTAEPGFRY